MDNITDSLYYLNPTLEEAKILHEEGIKLIDDDHIIHGFEKLYISAEDCIKILASKYLDKDGEILSEVKGKRKWNMPLLDEAARQIGEKTSDEEIEHYWMRASILDYEGVTIGIDLEYIAYLEEDFEKLLKITQNKIGERR